MDTRLNKKHYLRALKKCGVSFCHLSSSQKKEVKRIYKRYYHFYHPINYTSHELYMSVTGKFSPYIVPADLIYYNLFAGANDRKKTPAWADKNMFARFLPNAPFPKTYLRNINGIYMDENYHLLSMTEAEKKINGMSEVLVKPTENTHDGIGVKKIQKPSLMQIIGIYNSNFIVQEVIKQHPQLAALNETSVNVIRVMTIWISEKPELVACAVRSGSPGQIADCADPENCVQIGVDSNGYFRDFGFIVNDKNKFTLVV